MCSQRSGQIVALQCLYYISLGVLLLLSVGACSVRLAPRLAERQRRPHSPPLALLFLRLHRPLAALRHRRARAVLPCSSPRADPPSRLVICAHLLNAALGALYLSVVVERAKKCLDFAATLFALHLALCCAFRGWPRAGAWWGVNGASLVLMAVLGEWLCVRKEMREIPLTSGIGGQAQRAVSATQSVASRGLVALTAMGSTARTMMGGGSVRPQEAP